MHFTYYIYNFYLLNVLIHSIYIYHKRITLFLEYIHMFLVIKTKLLLYILYNDRKYALKYVYVRRLKSIEGTTR